MNEVTEEIKKVADHAVHPDHETDRDARKRQPWMPLTGAIVAGILLFAIAALFVL